MMMAAADPFQPFPAARSGIFFGIEEEARMTDKPGRLHQRLPELAADGRSGSRMAAALYGCADDGRHAKRYFQRGGSGIHRPRRNRNAGFCLFSNWRWMAADDGCAVSDDGCADGIQASHVALWMAAPSPMAMDSSTAADGIQASQGLFVGSSWNARRRFWRCPWPLVSATAPQTPAASNRVDFVDFVDFKPL